MEKNKTIRVTSWDELIKFIETINPYEKTILLTGWINQLYKDKVYIRELIFSTKSIEILREENDKENKKLDKRTNTKNKRKQR